MTDKTWQAILIALPALLLGVPASAGDSTHFAIEQDQVMIGFSARLGEHKQVVGVARTLGGSVEVASTGAQVKLRVPVAALESGSALVDAALRSTLDAEQFPSVELEASAPIAGGRAATLTFSGTLHMHGASVPLSVPAKVLRDGQYAFVHAVFPLSLEAFGISHASIAGAEVGDQVDISLDARLHTLPEGRTVPSF